MGDLRSQCGSVSSRIDTESGYGRVEWRQHFSGNHRGHCSEETFLDPIHPQGDLGDSWEHHLSVEQVRVREDRYGDGPVAGVEAGERACPPEDAGGVDRYQEFLEQWENDPYGEETEEVRTWAGLDFDPARFDRPAAAAAIDRMLSNGWIK